MMMMARPLLPIAVVIYIALVIGGGLMAVMVQVVMAVVGRHGRKAEGRMMMRRGYCSRVLDAVDSACRARPCKHKR
jgi:hypothetical protein